MDAWVGLSCEVFNDFGTDFGDIVLTSQLMDGRMDG